MEGNNSKHLDLYYEDIDFIFMETKKDLGFDNFTETSKRKFSPMLQDFSEKSKKYISSIFTDTEKSIECLMLIQMDLKQVLIGCRISDEVYKSTIYKMSPGYEIDSLQAFGFLESKWYPIIKR